MVLARAAVRKFPEVKHLIRIVALGLVFFIFANIAYNWASSIQYLFGPWSAQPPSADDYPRWLDYFAGSVISGEYVIEALAFLPVLILTIAEICNFPLRRRARIADKRTKIHSVDK
jgi:hypothetical protein